MHCFKGRVSWLVAAAAVVVLMAQVAEAQREGGRRGRGGRGMLNRYVSSVQLVSESDEVQVALDVTPEQKEKIDEINSQLREDRRGVWDRGGRDFRAAQGEMEKLNEEASAKLAEVLDANQQKRLLGISIQVNGAAAFNDPAVAKELNITDEQKTKLADVRESSMRAARDMSREERRAKAEELRADTDKKLLAVLTSEQQSQFESLKGEPVEVDMSDFRGSGRDGGGRDRGRDRADRDADENAADSSN